MKTLIIVPTIDGREDHLQRCLDAYNSTSTKHEIRVIRNKPTCGIAWQEGSDMGGDYDFIHLTADDLIPHTGWQEAAIEIALQGNTPAPLQLDSSGAVVGAKPNDGEEVTMSVIPFATRELWDKIQPMAPWHYYTDDYFSARAKNAGAKVIFSSAYKFTHNFAQVGRGAGMTEPQRMNQDSQAYMRWLSNGTFE